MNYYVARETNGVLTFRGNFSNPANAKSVGIMMGTPYKIITELERNNALAFGLSYASLHSYDEPIPSVTHYAEELETPKMQQPVPSPINSSLPDITQMPTWKVKFLVIDTVEDCKQLLTAERDGKERRGVIRLLEERISTLEGKQK